MNCVDIPVYCPRDKGMVYNVPVYYEDVESRHVPLQSQGCENRSGCDLCDRCAAAITLYVLDNPTSRLYFPEPIFPKLP